MSTSRINKFYSEQITFSPSSPPFRLQILPARRGVSNHILLTCCWVVIVLAAFCHCLLAPSSPNITSFSSSSLCSLSAVTYIRVNERLQIKKKLVQYNALIIHRGQKSSAKILHKLLQAMTSGGGWGGGGGITA